jgi:UPF0042 nucleotide-binding protein
MRFLVITGMSGAGKSLVIKKLEDLGFYCVDNMPPALMSKFFEIVLKGESKINKVALVVDIRGGNLFNELLPAINFIKDSGYPIEILFLEASDETLIKRFKESRRSHPLARSATIKKGLLEERKILENVKDRASFVIDTTDMSSKKLKEKIDSIFADSDNNSEVLITIVSFGFKYGIPADCDLVFDVRFIPNPFYIEEMKKLSGKDKMVKDFVMSHEETRIFISKTVDLLDFLLPYYKREGKSQLLIGLGCTGGHHRSVCISESIFEMLREKNHIVNIEHRDIRKDNRGVGK